jgi:hypothetical protein
MTSVAVSRSRPRAAAGREFGRVRPVCFGPGGRVGTSINIVVGATELIDTKKSPYGPQDKPNAGALSREQIKSRRFEEVVLLMKLCLVGYFQTRIYRT